MAKFTVLPISLLEGTACLYLHPDGEEPYNDELLLQGLQFLMSQLQSMNKFLSKYRDRVPKVSGYPQNAGLDRTASLWQRGHVEIVFIPSRASVQLIYMILRQLSLAIHQYKLMSTPCWVKAQMPHLLYSVRYYEIRITIFNGEITFCFEWDKRLLLNSQYVGRVKSTQY